MRVVIDTNVLVSFALRFNPVFEKIFDYVAAHGVSLISESTISEIFATFNREKFRKYISLDSALDYVEWYIGISETIIVTERITICRDPKDDKFLEVAVSGHADVIICGDKDLLALDSFRGIAIVPPAVFVEAITRKP